MISLYIIFFPLDTSPLKPTVSGFSLAWTEAASRNHGRHHQVAQHYKVGTQSAGAGPPSQGWIVGGPIFFWKCLVGPLLISRMETEVDGKIHEHSNMFDFCCFKGDRGLHCEAMGILLFQKNVWGSHHQKWRSRQWWFPFAWKGENLGTWFGDDHGIINEKTKHNLSWK